jgi:hypothetical protein
MGPYFWDSAWMDRWGSEPMRFRFPTMGHVWTIQEDVAEFKKMLDELFF